MIYDFTFGEDTQDGMIEYTLCTLEGPEGVDFAKEIDDWVVSKIGECLFKTNREIVRWNNKRAKLKLRDFIKYWLENHSDFTEPIYPVTEVHSDLLW